MKKPNPHSAPTLPARHARTHSPRRVPRSLDRQEQFLICVFSGAIARDIALDTNDAQCIARAAAAIPPDQIPPMPVNAATAFLHYCSHGPQRGGPFKWMYQRVGTRAR